MLFQFPGNLIHVCLDFGVLGFHGFELVAGLFEQTEQALFLLFLLAEALEFYHQIRKRFSHFTQVLGAHGREGVFRKSGHILLRGGTVLKHHIGVRDINFPGKFLHGFFLCLRKQRFIHVHRRGRGLGGLLRSLGSGGVQSQLRYCLGSSFGIRGEGQLGKVVPFISHRSVPPFTVWLRRGPFLRFRQESAVPGQGNTTGYSSR